MQATHQLQPYDVANSEPLPDQLKDGAAGTSLTSVNVHSTERWVSTLLGGVLLARGLSQRSSSRKLLAMVGSGLLFRGVTGHCHVYRWMNVSTAD